VDRVFSDTSAPVGDFQFDDVVAGAFDNMVSRSVPYYGEIQRMVSELAAAFAEPGTDLYDLGCSTGNTMQLLDTVVDPTVRFVGIDNSSEMLAKARAKLEDGNFTRPYNLIEADLHALPTPENASVVTMILTLMFVRPVFRQRFLNRLYAGLNPGGCLILVEKLTIANSMLNRLFIDNYYAYKKRSGYSEVEITRKREALENVLIPYRYDENKAMLQEAGFKCVEEFFRWYNFCGIIAIK
jgi:tRNA (cmo5U34)-methyltransferase